MIRPVNAPRLTPNWLRGILLFAFGNLFGLGLYACGSIAETPTPTVLPPSAVPSATVGFPTLPPTATHTPPPSPTPTPDIGAILGPRLFHDDFSADVGWDLGGDALGASSLEAGRLVIALHQAGTFRYVVAPAEPVTDFYLQVTLRTELCSPNDEFGVLVRLTPDGEYYRIGLYCDGRARVTRVLRDSSIALVLPTASPVIIAGAPAENVLAVLAEAGTFRILLNGFETFVARDRALPSGRLALFGRSSRSAQLTVSFDDLEVYALIPTPTPTLPPAP
jgi:hypothetical protein